MSAADGSPLEAEGSLHAALQAFSMIVVSEIGDKTFLIAAIMAMRHPRAVVFAGAFASLVVMSILSAAMGHVLPTLIPKRWTQLAAGGLFLVFGAKLGREGMAMAGGNEKVLEEMREAEEEIDEDVAAHEGTGRVTADGEVIPLEAIEAGTGGGSSPPAVDGDATPPPTPKTTKFPSGLLKGRLEGVRNLCSFLFGPVFVQVFVLTFLGEWGDRSQIATIMLAAAHNVYLVAIGTILGHTVCSGLAVVGGRYISTKISAKHVTLGGAALFLCFGIIYLYEASQTVDFDPHDHIPIG